MGMSEQQLLVERVAQRLLSVVPRDSGQHFYPVFQFESMEGRVRVRPGLISFMQAVGPRDPWTTGVISVTPMDELDGLTPVEWLRQGQDIEWLVTIGHQIRSEWR
jgi:hypothetical protein